MPYTQRAMRKLLLLSMVISLVAIPIIASREKSGTRSLKKTALLILLFNLFFLVALRFIYSRVQ
jgi:hypothetical protein